MHTMAVGGPAAKPSPSVSAASLIHRIFAGRICSKVRVPSFRENGSLLYLPSNLLLSFVRTPLFRPNSIDPIKCMQHSAFPAAPRD